MFAAGALLAAQWLLARRKKLINEDDPYASRLMGQQIMFFPIALGLAIAAAHFINPQAGFYALEIVLPAMRLWQRIWHKKKITNPARLFS
jgi:hypothetical protein